MLLPPNLCQACVHQHRHVGGGTNEVRTCDAYPDGIPGEFLVGGAAHISSDGTDNGIVFESRGTETCQRIIESFATFWDTLGDLPDLGEPGQSAEVGSGG